MRKLINIERIILVAYLTIFSTAVNAAELPKGIMKLKGQDAPPLVLKNLDGEEWDIDNSRGHWVFLHFWATWCGPCRREMPTIQAIVPKFKNSNMEIVLVNTAESEDIIFEFIGSVAPDLDPLTDPDGHATEIWQPRGLPATFFVDPNGKLQYMALGDRAWNEPTYLDFINNLIKK